jgi:hypothetical protein
MSAWPSRRSSAQHSIPFHIGLSKVSQRLFSKSSCSFIVTCSDIGQIVWLQLPARQISAWVELIKRGKHFGRTGGCGRMRIDERARLLIPERDLDGTTAVVGLYVMAAN